MKGSRKKLCGSMVVLLILVLQSCHSMQTIPVEDKQASFYLSGEFHEKTGLACYYSGTKNGSAIYSVGVMDQTEEKLHFFYEITMSDAASRRLDQRRNAVPSLGDSKIVGPVEGEGAQQLTSPKTDPDSSKEKPESKP